MNHKGIGRWSGTVTMEQVTIFSGPAMSGRADKKIITTFVDALPTMYRNVDMSKPGAAELKFTDDKGKGSYTFHSEVTIGGQKGTTDCNGSGEAELHAVTINESDHTYDIEVIGPACSGTTTSAEGTQPYGPDTDDDITITEPLGSSIDVLDGTTTGTSKDPAGLGTQTTTISWHLTRSNDDDVLIITPQNYDTWLPEPGKDEFHAGNYIQIHLALEGNNGLKPKMKVREFELRLSGISREPGITLNQPLFLIQPLPDIRFAPRMGEVRGDTDQTLSVKSYNDRAADVMIEAFDGGGFATLTAEAILEDNSRVKGHLLVKNGESEVLLPKRAPGSHIGTAWLSQHGNPADDDDTEKSKDNPYKGDGLTAYEEYRGVIADGKFLRLDPQKKEVAVHIWRNQKALLEEGIKWFENASDIKPILFYEKEIELGRMVNRNSIDGHGHLYDQYALNMEIGQISKPGVIGKAFGDGPGIPEKTTIIKIDYDKMVQMQQAWEDFARTSRPPFTLPYSLSEKVASTVAHELSHGVNVFHHGESVDCTPSNPRDSTRYVLEANGALIARQLRDIDETIGGQGNQESGDLSCFMIYNPYCEWACSKSSDSIILRHVAPFALGKKLCKSSNGTGFNAMSNYFGNATKGNCLSQIKLK